MSEIDPNVVKAYARGFGFLSGQIDYADGTDSYPIIRSVADNCFVEFSRVVAHIKKLEDEITELKNAAKN
jgi:hypothetical protein